MDRQKQIELMEGAEQRVAGFVRTWIKKSPELNALVRRRDSEKYMSHHVVKKVRAYGR